MATPPDGIGIELGDVTPDGRSVTANVRVDDAVITRATIREVIDQACPRTTDGNEVDEMTDAVWTLLSSAGGVVPDAVPAVLALAAFVDMLPAGHHERAGIIRAIEVLNDATRSPDHLDDLRYGDVVVDAEGHGAVWLPNPRYRTDPLPWVSLHPTGDGIDYMARDAVEWPLSFVYRPTAHLAS